MPKRKFTPEAILAEFFLGKTITALTLDNEHVELQTATATLRVVPNRFEQLSATLGQLIAKEVTGTEMATFIAGKTVASMTHECGHTVLRFSSGESVIIAGEPNVETDINNTYTITKLQEEDLLDD